MGVLCETPSVALLIARVKVPSFDSKSLLSQFVNRSALRSTGSTVGRSARRGPARDGGREGGTVRPCRSRSDLGPFGFVRVKSTSDVGRDEGRKDVGRQVGREGSLPRSDKNRREVVSRTVPTTVEGFRQGVSTPIPPRSPDSFRGWGWRRLSSVVLPSSLGGVEGRSGDRKTTRNKGLDLKSTRSRPVSSPTTLLVLTRRRGRVDRSFRVGVI